MSDEYAYYNEKHCTCKLVFASANNRQLVLQYQLLAANMMSVIFQWLIGISFSISIIYFLSVLKQLRSSNHANLPPGPKPLPVVGNLFVLGASPHRSLAELAKSYGPIISLKLGQVTTVVVSSPDLAREVLVKKDHACCSRSVPDASRVLDHPQDSVIWLPASSRWKRLRVTCATHLFTSQILDFNKALRHRKASDLVAYLRERGAAGEPVDVGRAAFTTSLNLISNTFFSVDMGDIRSGSAQDFRDLLWRIMVEVGGANVSDFFPVVRVFDLQGKRRRMDGYLRRLHEIFDELIDQRVEATDPGCFTKNRDFLDALINCGELDRKAMKSLLVDVFVAGIETSSNTAEWAMAELLHTPRSMAKARAELAGAFDKGSDIDETVLLKLPYLQAVVKETFRLHPAAPFLLPRKTETSIDLGGYDIPEGTRVLVNAWAIGRDESVWGDDAGEFVPERFLGREAEFRGGGECEFIPFGAGRRICPGLPLGVRTVHLMLAAMLREFKWELVDGMKAEDVELNDKFGLALALATPLRAIPAPDE